MENTITPLERETGLVPPIPQVIGGETPPVKKSRARTWIVAGLFVLGLLVTFPLWQFMGEFFGSFPAEMQAVSGVLDDFFVAMEGKDAQNAYALLSATGEAQIGMQDLQKFVRGDYYVLFDGYRELSLTGFQMTQVGAFKYAEVEGNVFYEGGLIGEFAAVMAKDNGEWKIRSIQVTIPPDKVPGAN